MVKDVNGRILRDGVEVRRRWAEYFEQVLNVGRSVPYGQTGVYGGSKWRSGTRETEVRLDRWYESGLRQQRNDGGGCASMRVRSERVESPGTYVTE